MATKATYPTNWASNSSYQIGTSTGAYCGGGPIGTTSSPSLTVNGKIILNGESLDERLTRIENLLYIPQRDIELEKKYERLRDAWAAYQEALDGCKNWEILKRDY